MRSFNFDLLSLLFFKSFSGGTGAADPNLFSSDPGFLALHFSYSDSHPF